MSIVVGDVEERARQTRGESNDAILQLAARLLHDRGAHAVVVDAGCGVGRLRHVLPGAAPGYIGVDAMRYPGFPSDAQFLAANLDIDRIPVGDDTADAAVALETIEHLENPRRLVRELTRIVRPGGTVIVSTPNQVSLLSLATLAVKHRFNAFQDADYPAHRTALLEIDLVRMAQECGLVRIETRFTSRGRVPFTGAHYPGWLARRFPRALSDNVLLVSQKPARGSGER
ncbi:MAG TPA: methyltransferase domain-containing protein [Vicinamibacterales bacterium]|jgi:2-polyprenyl-3-methyl-5-hydroxy-6-metoxy-1,4-benzoquinol methylase|nr:methyltransferase domain-containing protein [Vicinamibacterales bacterium]